MATVGESKCKKIVIAILAFQCYPYKLVKLANEGNALKSTGYTPRDAERVFSNVHRKTITVAAAVARSSLLRCTDGRIYTRW